MLQEANFTEVEVGLQSIDAEAQKKMDRKNNLRAFERGVRAMLGRGIAVKVDLIGSWEPGGVDYPKVFRALHSIGYNGYVTAFAAFSSFATPQEAAAKSYEHLKPLAAKA